MNALHALLLRQLRNFSRPGAPEGAADFIEAVNSACHQFDHDGGCSSARSTSARRS